MSTTVIEDRGHKVTLVNKEKLDYRTNEAYKSLRTNVQFCGNDVKVISFTSCTPNEGKSSVSFNLANSFAEMGKRVIMVDADLRKSVLLGRYKVKNFDNGLSHYLSGQMDLPDIIAHTDVDGLDVIFSGPFAPNPAELVGSEKMRKMIETLRGAYDYVFIDTPPLGSVIDAALIGRFSDGVIIVIENGAISYRFAQNVKKQLDQGECHIIGTVLNKVPMSKRGYYGHYYGKYYGHYYGSYYGNYGHESEEEGSSSHHHRHRHHHHHSSEESSDSSKVKASVSSESDKK